MSTETYRWNAAAAAEAYDAAAPLIHPRYCEVQDALIAEVPASAKLVIDLGGGSGRLAERLLWAIPSASVAVVDPSEPFLRLCERRLSRFGDRARTLRERAEGAWAARFSPPDAIVSTSALHHLDGDGKNAAFRAAHDALRPGGVFLNGDEYRPPSDAAYRRALERWRDHMRSALAAGLIPESFADSIDRWEERNLLGFGGPRETGDDCHETVEEQIARLYGAGFCRVRVVWRDWLWGVVVATKG